MVSFNVTNLLTQVPLAEAIHIISSHLMEAKTLEERSQIPGRNICELIDLYLKSTYFRFQDAFHEQVDGAAMGSPLSPVVDNVYMDIFEK